MDWGTEIRRLLEVLSVHGSSQTSGFQLSLEYCRKEDATVIELATSLLPITACAKKLADILSTLELLAEKVNSMF